MRAQREAGIAPSHANGLKTQTYLGPPARRARGAVSALTCPGAEKSTIHLDDAYCASKRKSTAQENKPTCMRGATMVRTVRARGLTGARVEKPVRRQSDDADEGVIKACR